MKTFLEWSAYQKEGQREVMSRKLSQPTSKKEAAEMNLIDETQSRFWQK